MLCELCQEREATVHVAVVSWPTSEVEEHLCETCYPAAEAARIKPYVVPPPVPLPENVELISATEYLQFSIKAAESLAYKPAFKHVCKELERFPATRARLALEFLRMELRSPEQGKDPHFLIRQAGCFGNSVQTGMPPEYGDLLEKIVVRSFEDLVKSPTPTSAPTFGFGLSLAFVALCRADPKRGTELLAKIKEPGGQDAERRRSIAQHLERRIAIADRKRPRRKRDTE
jgi:hypothetical protein